MPKFAQIIFNIYENCQSAFWYVSLPMYVVDIGKVFVDIGKDTFVCRIGQPPSCVAQQNEFKIP